MTDYNPIPDNVLEPDDPIPADLGIRWRDNPIAMFEGAPGAPRLDQPAMGAWYTTTGGIGTYAFLSRRVLGVGSVIVAGTSYAGSQLRYAGVSEIDGLNSNGATPSGTWLAMGSSDEAGSSAENATLFIRIA